MNATGGATTLNVYGDFTNNGTFTQNAQTFALRETGSATTQTIYGSGAFTIDTLTFNKAIGGGFVKIAASALTITTLTFSGNFTFNILGGGTLILPNGVSIPANISFILEQNSIVKVSNANTITVAGGTFKVNGAQSVYPAQTLANSGEVTVNGAGTWNFNATSGTVDLTGWIFDKIATTGAVIGNGTASVTLTNLRNGQFTNLSSVTTSTLKINTTGSIPATASNIGWGWQGLNAQYLGGTSPLPTDGYSLASSTGCSNATMTFTNWFGDWYMELSNPVPNTKVSNTNCNLTIDPAQSPVSLIAFTGTPYNAAVVLDWVTGLEWNHQGFNVYRSLSPDSGFAQINSGLIRNAIISSSAHGIYQFYDANVQNDLIYYYRIEDFATDGTRTIHGPVSAMPSASLGAPPASDPSAIVGTNPNSPPPGSSPAPGSAPFAPGIKEIAPGVHLLASTAHSMRLQIDVPAPSFSAASVSPYQKVSIAGYSLATETGKPELPQRIIMLEIPPSQTAAFTLVRHLSAGQSAIDIASSPAWTPSGGSLVPSWSLDAAFYSTDQMLPASAVSLGQITSSQGSYYLPIVIQPVRANPVQHTLAVSSQIIMDIDLDGVPLWGPVAASPSGVWAQEGALKISVSKAGLYKLDYSDFVAAGVDGAFENKDLSRFKLYSVQNEIPLEVNSTHGGSFGLGDSITFYAPYFDSGESTKNNLMLVADAPISALGLRMGTLDGNPALSVASTESSYPHRVHVEQNVFENLGAPYAEGIDHIFWGQFMASPGDRAQDSFSGDAILPHLNQLGNVTITARFAGSYGYNPAPGLHHVKLWINSSTVSAGEAFFFGNDPYTAVFNVSASELLEGLNRMKFQAIGDLSGGDYDVVLLDWFEITYPHDFVSDQDIAQVYTSQRGTALSVSGFSGNDLLVYDVSDSGMTAKVSNAVATLTGGGTYSVAFASSSIDPAQGRNFWITRAGTIQKPDSLELNPGSSLSDTAQSFDAIYVGTAENLDAVRPLADLRTRQGFRVKLIDIEDIYSEFGQGLFSAQVLKDFIHFAATQWAAPALKYVILVGDGTDDPRNSLGIGTKNTLPVHMMLGSAQDFASDNWFVAFNPGDDLPNLSIGRIPGNTPNLISAYVSKVMAYEEGSSRPQGQAAKDITFIADQDQLGEEGFAPRVAQLSSQISSINSALNPKVLSRVLVSDADLKQQIISSFNSGSVIINYFGHGAENIWAGNSVFTNVDADALSNNVYPVVITMDCLNAAHFYANGYQTLADRLLFNPNGGAIALWGSTSMTSSSSQAPYQTALYQVIASTPLGIRLGDALRLAKVTGGWDPAKAEVLRSLTLLGDPMINIITPAPAPKAEPAAEEKDHGGFLACGTISSGSGGSGGGPNPSALVEMGLLIMMVVASRKFLKVAPSFRLS
ncbi:MAG: C25 family cysteine peptidase [Bdellovibrionota bacterium]